MSVYNGEAYLADQLDSIVSQTYKNINVYIRDDGFIIRDDGREINVKEEYKRLWDNNATNKQINHL